ncbi:BspA family leucine-rich repeat surface protein [Mycoplasma capricolum subsp. capricolum]|uniref:BspA family leucine-rich repeat surface protein n=1 Tax=Mycoplasma capricolum TaxID=2095 RepID=UPI003DA29341
MKKLLTVLGSMTLIATVGTSVIACKTTDNVINETQLAQKVQTIWNDNFKDKITSAKNFSMIIEMIKEKLNSKEKELIDLSNKEESRKRPVKEQDNQKINIKVGKNDITLDFGKVVEGKKLTTYRDPETNEIRTTDVSDFSSKKNPELNNVKEIIEIGYFEHADNHDNNKIQIRAVVMPTSIEIVPKELPKEITSTREMFSDAKAFNQNLSNWDTSNLESIDAMFQGTKLFNQDISNWDVSNVRLFDYAFYESEAFDKDLSSWDVSKGETMINMFAKSKYNNGSKPLTWNEKTKNVKNMSTMFAKNPVFNQDISKWDVSNVTNMKQMFLEAKSFNQDLDNWDVSKVEDMWHMFGGASEFNGNIKNWKTQNVKVMGNMFNGATKFNQNISDWDTSNLEDMQAMFLNASSFEQDLSNWKVEKVKKYAGYHNGATKWTQEKRPKIGENKKK